MVQLKDLKEYADQIDQCVRCGACQAHCPVYRETLGEGSVARGKIALAASVLAGEIGLEPRLTEELSLCLLCGSCVVKCPNRVETDGIVAALRRRVTDEQGLSTVGRGVAALTGSKPLLRGLVRGAGMLAPLVFKHIPSTSGLRLRFAPAALKERTLPPIPSRSLFARVPEHSPAAPGRPTIGLFAGCAITYLYPQVGEALVRLLGSFGYGLFLPRTQGCCGMPALSSGNGALLTELAQANLAAFAEGGAETIVTACASCGGALTGHYADLGEDGRGLADRILDIHQFLDREGLIERIAELPKQAERIRVTYHDPCHLRTRSITREPRALLRALPQVELVEMDEAASCCGLGGTFAATQAELSRRIGDRKAAAIAASGAELVATGCPGCVLQLQDSIDRAGLRVRAVHTLDLVDQALHGDTA